MEFQSGPTFRTTTSSLFTQTLFFLLFTERDENIRRSYYERSHKLPRFDGANGLVAMMAPNDQNRHSVRVPSLARDVKLPTLPNHALPIVPFLAHPAWTWAESSPPVMFKLGVRGGHRTWKGGGCACLESRIAGCVVDFIGLTNYRGNNFVGTLKTRDGATLSSLLKV